MGKFIVNASVFGFMKEEIKSEKLLKEVDSDIVIVITQIIKDETKDYYDAVKKLVKNNRIYVVTDNSDLEIFKVIASYLISVDCYNIYKLSSISLLDIKYTESLLQRKPDFSEVQSFIDSDIVAEADINEIVLAIEDAAASGNVDILKTVLEDKLGSVYGVQAALSRMKKLADLTNSSELANRIANLKDEITEKQEEIANRDKRYNKLKADKEATELKVEKLEKEVEEVSNQLKQAKAIDKSNEGGNIIKDYTEIKLSLIPTTAKSVLYVKEISYAPYTNTLMTSFLAYVAKGGKKAIMVIFDDNCFFQTYKAKPGVQNGAANSAIPIVSTHQYIANNSQFINNGAAFVISGALPSVITDIVTSDKKFDLVIVYDRLKNPTDMVSGTQVTKMFVCNSAGDYLKTKDILRITERSLVLTKSGTSIPCEGAMAIADIPNFGEGTDSKRQMSYARMTSTLGKSKDTIYNTLLTKTRLL